MNMKFFLFAFVFFATLSFPYFNVTTIASTPDIGYAILVAGDDEGWFDRKGINSDTNKAYRVLQSLSFDDSRILYLNSDSPQDVDNDGQNEVDMVSSFDSLQYALTEWASVRVGPDSPLILYMAGHGTQGNFYLTDTSSVSPIIFLDGWLSHLPQGTLILVVIDACYSGSFITTEFNGEISEPNRILISSSDAYSESDSYRLYGSLFSHKFWDRLQEGTNVKNAFIEATDAANQLGQWLGQFWNPHLDDNGDAFGHSPLFLGDDGTLAETMTIGTYGGAPSIGEGPAPAAPFEDCYTRNGGSIVLGYPINKVHRWWDGYIQDFRGGEGYEGAIMQPDGEDTAYAIYGAIWAKYLSMGGAGGSLGYPITDENDLPDSSVTGCGCRYNEFQEGAIIYRKPTEDFNDLTAFLGWGIYLKWQDLGYGWYAVGLPVSDEYEAAQSGASGFDTTGVACDFEGGHIYWHRTGFWADNALEVHGEIDQVYQNEGGPGSWVGYPITDIYTNDSNYPEGTFQGGYITTTDGINYQAYPWASFPTVQTNPATSVSSTSAIIHGQIIDTGGGIILERRFDWGSTPSCCDGWTADVNISGDYFSYYLSGLQAGKKYYFRAWAKNEDGWDYGASLSFTTVAVQGCELLADFNTDYIVNFVDFATFASSWLADPDDINWNASCDISEPADNLIDEKDLDRFAQYWLFERFPYGGITTRVSVNSAGQEGNGSSAYPSLSADGRFVAFASDASNLVEGHGPIRNIFVHDRQTAETTVVNVSCREGQADAGSYGQDISADGRYVVFHSGSTILICPHYGGYTDIFVRDRQIGETTLVSVNSAGVQGNGDSGGYQNYPAISADGRYVAFGSDANNLVQSDTNGNGDIFVHDRQTGETTRVSVSSARVQGSGRSWWPAISANGRYVAFSSYASNLVQSDTNGNSDIFVHDRQTGETTRVSVSSAELQGNYNSYYPAISGDGRYIVFQSYSYNLVEGDNNWAYDIFVHDRQTAETTRVSVSSVGVQANDDSWWPGISANGRFVAFASNANNLVEGDTNGYDDVFVHDRQTGETTRVSVSSAGVQANERSSYHPAPAFSADGRYVGFGSYASNLVEGDTNGAGDIFVHDRFAGSLADLVVSDITTQPAPPNAADFTTVSIQIKNQGLSDATETFFLEFYFDGVYQGHVYVDGLEAGDTQTSTWYGILWPGDTNNHTLKGVVDPDNAIAEYNETNNQHPEQFAAPSLPTGTGTLKIQSNPGGANVYIDDEYKGQTPASGYLTISDLPAGDHGLKVTKSGYNDWTDVVIIPPGKTNYEAVILEPTS